MRRPHQFMIGRLLVWVGVALILTMPGASRATDHAISTEQLVEALGKIGEPETRLHAAERLGRMGIGTKSVVTALIRALDSDIDPAVRGRAAQALGLVGTGMDSAIEALVEALEWDDSLNVRWRVVEALERVGSASDEVASVLVNVLRTDKLPGVRARAAEAIGSFCSATESVVPILTKALLSDDHPGVRWQAARGLEKCAINLQRTKATGAIDTLKEALIAMSAQNHQPDIQTNAAAVRHVIEDLERELDQE